MPISFKDSMDANKDNNSTNNNATYSIGTTPFSLNDAIADLSDESILESKANTSAVENWTRHEGYEYYEDYSDDNISTIDDNKNISLNSKQFNITQESNSQFIPFEMPRYYDGFDLTKTTLFVHFVNAGNYENLVRPVNVFYSNNKIKFAWLIGKDAAAVAGNLKFEIKAQGVNSKGNEYIWISRSNSSLNVIQSLSGNGVIEPDESWITGFLTQVTDQVGNAQKAAKDAESASNEAVSAANEAKEAVSTAKTELEATVDESVASRITEALSTYYDKDEVDKMFEEFDISDQLKGVQDQLDSMDGLAKFSVAYDSSNLTFFNGETPIGEPITIPPTTYLDEIDGKVTALTNKVSSDISAVNTKIDDDLKPIKEDLESIHSDIDGLPETLKSDYYTKDDSDGKFATKPEVSAVDTKVSGFSSSIETNKQNISKLSSTVKDLSDTVNGIDTSARLTYDINYNDPDDANTSDNKFVLYEIEHEGEKDEVRTPKKIVTIVGGGGGGGATSSTLKIEYITTTPLVATVDDNVIIKYRFSGTDSSGDTVMEGAATWRVNGTVVATNTAISGENSFDVTKYLSIGTQKVQLSIVDDAGSLVTKNWTVQKIDVRLESSFNDKLTYPMGDISFDYTPYGAISKVVHFKLDGKEIGTVATAASGIPMAYNIPEQTHGAHLLDAYMTAEINGNTIESNHITKDIIWYDSTSNKPVIGCTLQNFTAKQYASTSIEYSVYDPSTESPVVELAVDGKVISTLTLDSNTQVWQYKSSDVGEHVLTITCGETVKTLHATIEKIDIEIEPVTAGLVFDFDPTGKSNNDSDRLFNDGTTSMEVSDNFDWVNGGYQIDEDGDQYFCIKAGTKATINHKLFADDAKRSGKEFKIIFKTTNVSDASANFLICLDSSVGIEMNVHDTNIYSGGSPMFLPYSEDDIIEFEFNINENTNAVPAIMAYEDGVAMRAKVYKDTDNFTQSNPKNIVIGSDHCDVYIYRMKAYNAALTDRGILNNFIADARTAEEMIDRYNRNQIYDENGQLNPDVLAEKCPQLRIIKIDAPWFTNDKKDKVSGTNVQCIYKDGDPILDNWTLYDCQHSGRTITCPLHMETCA